jgi:membrane protein DedA with SNARE-associated domain
MVFFWALLILIGMITADFFVPMLPSATLVTAAAGLVLGSPWLIVVLLVGAAASSWFGEFMGYKVFRAVRAGLRRRPPGFAVRLAERSVMGKVLKLEKLLRGSVAKHPYRTTVVARFLPAGRTTLAWIAAGGGRVPYGRMAALGGVLWAVYTVSLGLLIAWIAGPGLQSLLGSVLTVLAVGAVLGWVAKHWQKSHAAEAESEPVLAIAAGPEPGPLAAVPGPDSVVPLADPVGPVNGPAPVDPAKCGLKPGGATGTGLGAEPGSARAALRHTSNTSRITCHIPRARPKRTGPRYVTYS